MLQNKRLLFIIGMALFLLICGRVKIAPPDLAFYYSYGRSLLYDMDYCFANEYAQFTFGAHETYLTQEGYPANDWPMGTGLCWIPFFLISQIWHLFASLFGNQELTNGFSWLDKWIVTYGSTLFFGCGTLWLTFRFGQKTNLKTRPLLWSLILLSLGSSFTYHLFVNSADSHLPSAFFIVLFLVVWQCYKEKGSTILLISAGIVLGMASLVRPHNVLFILTPIIEHVASRRKIRELGSIVLIGTIALVVFLPQLMVWKTLYGSWLAIPRSEDVRWFNPQLFNTLFSDFHGMVSWSPLFGLGLLGLFFKKKWIPYLIPVLLQLYIYSCNIAWWSGGSFGNRRMIGCAPLFILGLATLLERYPDRWLKIICITGAIWTHLLLIAELGGTIQLDHYQSWAEIFHAIPSGFTAGLAYYLPIHEWQNHTYERLIGCGIVLFFFVLTYLLYRQWFIKHPGFMPVALSGFLILFVGMSVLATQNTRHVIKGVDCSDYIQRDRFSWVIYFEKGFYKANTGRTNEALKTFLAATLTEPRHPQPWMYIGMICYMKKWHPLDYYYFENALRRGQTRAFYLQSFETVLTRMIQIRKNRLPLYYNQRGIVRLLLNKPTLAQADFREALRIDPDYQTARNNLDILLNQSPQGRKGFMWK